MDLTFFTAQQIVSICQALGDSLCFSILGVAQKVSPAVKPAVLQFSETFQCSNTSLWPSSSTELSLLSHNDESGRTLRLRTTCSNTAAWHRWHQISGNGLIAWRGDHWKRQSCAAPSATAVNWNWWPGFCWFPYTPNIPAWPPCNYLRVILSPLGTTLCLRRNPFEATTAFLALLLLSVLVVLVFFC